MPSIARRSTLIAFAALLSLGLAATSAPAQSPGATPGMGPVAQQEKAIWDALQSSSWDTVAAYMAPNFVYVGDVMGDRAQSMEGMKACKLNSYALRDPQTRALSKDIVLLTYIATEDELCGTQAIKADFNCSSVWQRQDGKWMGVSHTEAMVAKH